MILVYHPLPLLTSYLVSSQCDLHNEIEEHKGIISFVINGILFHKIFKPGPLIR